MRYAVSNLHRTHKRSSSSLDSTTSSVPNSKGFYPFTLIQTIIFILFCCQFIILTYLYFHFDFFQHSSLYDFKKSFILSSSHSSSHLLSPQEIHNNEIFEVDNEEKPRREIHKAKIQVIEELKYEIYPVTIRSVDKTDHMKPSSKELVKSLLGPVVEVDFPDLAYWTPESIKERYPTMFNELPKLGFHDDYKNPCWFRSLDSSNSNVDGGTSSVSRLVCLPYAYILGQPKSGTSDLFERLKAHPSIVMPARKEVRWFTRGEFTLSPIPHEGEESDFTGGGEERRGERLLGKGSSIFTFTRAFMPLARALSTQPNRKNELVTIDGGPHTLWWPTQAPDGEYLTKDVPPVQLIHELQPNAKFLITVVDPVKRFYSDYYFLGDDLKPVKPGRVGVKSPEQLHERVTEQIDLFNVCIKRYMKRLVPQYHELKKKNGKSGDKDNNDANNQLFDDLPQLLKENNIKLDLSREYLTYFPLWFRSAQMCAHDRHTFAKGGWGRLSISLYILYLVKWYEYFPINQFHIIRLEDYPNNPKQYLQSIFSFLDLPIDADIKKEEEIWNKILVDKHYNQHRIARQPLLEETETLLRDFYRPYNQLLALVLKNQSFLWDPITTLGLTKTLRTQLIEELKYPLTEQGRNGRIKFPQSPYLPPTKPQENQHSPERSKIFLHEDTASDVPPEQNPSQSLRGNSKPRGLLQLTPHAFSIDDLPLPPPKDKTVPDEPANNDDLTIFDGIDWTDTLTAGKHLCGAAFSLNLYHLKYLLYDIGIPSDTVYQNDGKRNAWHCLASIWSMGEAHSRSHVFAELKGRTTWVTNHLHPPLEKKIASVLSMDILSHLEEDILKVAQWLERAKVPINALDVGGFTPLHHAVVGGEVGLIKFLIGLKEIDINKLDHMHRNPLHYAAAYGHSEIIQLLVEEGGNIRQIDRHGVTPYDIIATPGPVSAEDALVYANITQRPARKIKRYLHPEYYTNDSIYGWVGGTGGWGAERLQGFEEDMECNGIDQYLWNEITSADIFSKYLSKNTPVLIRGLLNYWPVVKTFKQENLIKTFGDIRVQVSDIPYAQKFGGSDMVEMTLAEYIEEVKNHRLIGGQHPWYVFRGHPIPQGSESKTSFVKHDTCPLPDLIKNAFLSACPIPPESGREREMFVNAQWALGGEGTGAPVHFHNTAWAALLYGAKKWLIYPPHAMIMSNKQILNYYETDRITFEERGIKPITCVQTAGDVMIIPESYGHGVLNIQESIAIATEFKHSMWRIRPPPRIVGEVSEFDNRSDKKNNRPREARRVRKARPVT